MTNAAICKRFHKTILQEFFQTTLGKKLYETVETLLADLDDRLNHYNIQRTHQGKCVADAHRLSYGSGKETWKDVFRKLNVT